MFGVLVFLLVSFINLPLSQPVASAGGRLYDALKEKYDKVILPVDSVNDNVNIRLLLQLVQLTDIDEPKQIMTTVVWVNHEWVDAGLRWDPADFDGISELQLPADAIWLPDTVLYNNADGDYQITIKAKATVYNDGRVVWVPPAIYKSFCVIDVSYFPFDEQVCELKFGPWSYDISKVDYWLYNLKDPNRTLIDELAVAADMSEYSESVEWDILEVTAKRRVWEYPCCPEKYVDIQYLVKIRRKTLFYTINLVIPCVSISFLTILVFYLPSQSGEKITLSVSILVALTVFILLLYEIIPPTSLALPLLSKYLLFTMVMIAVSIIITIVCLNIHYRHPHNLDMPPWVRRLFLDYLPKLLYYHIPDEDDDDDDDDSKGTSSNDGDETSYPLLAMRRNVTDIWQKQRHDQTVEKNKATRTQSLDYEGLACLSKTLLTSNEYSLCTHPKVRQALRDVAFIYDRYKDGNAEEQKVEDWQTVSRVLDRLFFIIFSLSVAFASVTILAASPSLYDTRSAIG